MKKLYAILLVAVLAVVSIENIHAMQPQPNKEPEKPAAVPTGIRPIDQALIDAVKERNVNEVNRLVAAGAKSNAVSDADWTALIRDSAY